jgi:hypothetical protein
MLGHRHRESGQGRGGEAMSEHLCPACFFQEDCPLYPDIEEATQGFIDSYELPKESLLLGVVKCPDFQRKEEAKP